MPDAPLTNNGRALPGTSYKAASFWVQHNILLRQLGFGAGALFILTSLVFTGWTLLDVYGLSRAQTARSQARLAQFSFSQGIEAVSAPASLEPSSVQTFARLDGRMDVVATIQNPNTGWRAEIDYAFSGETMGSSSRRTTILPGESRLVSALGLRAASAPSLQINRITWIRVDPKMTRGNYGQFSDERLNFAFEDITYTPNFDVNGVALGRSSFRVRNNSGFGYRDLELGILLYQNQVPVGVTQLTSPELRPGEVRLMEANWIENPQNVNRTVITPHIDILNPASYLPVSRLAE